MPTDDLTRLERQHGFQYPAIYRRLHDDGMLDWGETGPNWLQTEFPRLQQRPPLLLYGDSYDDAFEGMSLEEVEETLSDWYDGQDHPAIDPAQRIVPFGGDGSGDHHCFDFNAAQGDAIPIAHQWHDSHMCHRVAADVQDFIFMHMLAVGISSNQRHPDRLSEALMAGGLQRYLQSHAPYLKPAHLELLSTLYLRPFKFLDEEGYQLQLASRDEQLDWIERLAPYAQRGQRFAYRQDPPPPAKPRRVGQLTLSLPIADAQSAALKPLLKVLNWRSQAASNNALEIVYVRRQSVFFGEPAWHKLDEGVRGRLLCILQACPSAQLVFVDDETSQPHRFESLLELAAQTRHRSR